MLQEIVAATLTTTSLALLTYIYKDASAKAKQEIESRYNLICHDLDLHANFLLNLYLEERKYASSKSQQEHLEDKIDFFEDLKEYYTPIEDKTQRKTLQNLVDVRYFSLEQKQVLYQKYQLIRTLINTNTQRIKLL